MASFDSSPQEHVKASSKRYPYRRLEPSIQKFIKVLQVDLERLSKHRANIEKYQALQQWDLLTKEQINSSHTVKQLKATIKQLEHTRAQILSNEQDRFDNSIGDIRHKTITAIIEFLDLLAGYDLHPLLGPCKRQSLIDEGIDKIVAHKVRQHSTESTTEHSGDDTDSPGGSTVHLELKQLTVEKPATEQAHHAWQDLKTSLVELNSLIQEFSTLVYSQQEAVDQIEDNTEHAQANVQQGTEHLGAASKLKTAICPVAGALLGGALAGPVGFVAGVKLGGLAAVTGGLAGFTGGHILKEQSNKAHDMQLQKLSSRSSQTPSPSEDTTSSSQTLPSVVSASKDTPSSPSARSSYSDPGI